MIFPNIPILFFNATRQCEHLHGSRGSLRPLALAVWSLVVDPKRSGGDHINEPHRSKTTWAFCVRVTTAFTITFRNSAI